MFFTKADSKNEEIKMAHRTGRTSFQLKKESSKSVHLFEGSGVTNIKECSHKWNLLLFWSRLLNTSDFQLFIIKYKFQYEILPVFDIYI